MALVKWQLPTPTELRWTSDLIQVHFCVSSLTKSKLKAKNYEGDKITFNFYLGDPSLLFLKDYYSEDS